jgi:large repetitive protein
VPGGAAVSVTSTTPGQNARLAFTGTAGQVVSLSAGPLCCTSKLSIVAPDGSTVAGPTLMSSSGGFVDATTLPKTGTYGIVVDPQGAATGSSTLKLFDVPPDATAAIVPGGGAVSVQTTTPGQDAKLSFTGVAGRRASLNVAPTCCATSVSILAPDGSELASGSSITTTGLFLEPWTLTQAGSYTIVVDPKAAAKGSMTLTLYDVPADVAATTSIGGPPLTLALSTPGQNAAVVFDGTAGRTITLQISGVTITQSKLAVTNPDGSNLVSSQSVYTSGKTLTAQLLASGAHTITVNPVSAYVGSMTLAVR